MNKTLYHGQACVGKQEIEHWNIIKTITAYIKIGILFSLRWIQNILAIIVPVKKNRIVVYIHRRKGYTCNPKYIVENLLAQYPNKYEIIWVTSYPESCTTLTQKKVKVVKAFSFQHFWFHFTAKVLVSNDCLYRRYIKRKEQLYINTWHGAINYKQIGYDGLCFSRKIQRCILN